MQIDIPGDQYEKLTAKAQAAGYDGVPAFIKALADEPTDDPRGPLSAEELSASLDKLRESEADIAAGRTEDMRLALRQIAEEHGLKIR
jgi:hypothetical protein